MKLFWKIFFTTMFVSAICVALSGYILTDAHFRAQLDSEVRTARDYGEIVYYSLAHELSAADRYDPQAAGAHAGGLLAPIVESISIDSMNQTISFALIDARQGAVFSSLPVALDKEMISALDAESAGWTVKELGERIYVQAMRPAVYLDSVFYIETVRDVTHVFAAQRSQYEMMLKLLAGMLLFAGAVTFLVSKLLLRRVTALTEITKTISGGDLTVRAGARGRDEIALLSENFNQMADSLEDKLRELREEAERKELFVGAFSHELKTPLTSIIGYADLLRGRELTAEQRDLCAGYIFSEGKRLEALSMRLLELIVLRRREFAPVPREIGALLEETAELMAPQLADAGLTLVREVERAVIPMEADLLKTVFLNLLDNARKAMDGPGRIVLTGRREKGAYAVTIRDSGRGMAKGELARITDAFYTADKSRARRQGGAGLGLAICKEILTLHGFTLSLDSTPGAGTTVTVLMKEADYDRS